MGRNALTLWDGLTAISVFWVLFISVWSEEALAEKSVTKPFAIATKKSVVLSLLMLGLPLFLYFVGAGLELFLLFVGALLIDFYWRYVKKRKWLHPSAEKRKFKGLSRAQIEVPKPVTAVEFVVRIALFSGLVLFVVKNEKIPQQHLWLAILSFGFAGLILQWVRWSNYARLKVNDPILAAIAFYNPVDGFFRKRGWINT